MRLLRDVNSTISLPAYRSYGEESRGMLITISRASDLLTLTSKAIKNINAASGARIVAIIDTEWYCMIVSQL